MTDRAPPMKRILTMKADSELVSNTAQPNPKRVAAGKQNRAKRRGLTQEGQERLRNAALRNQPWMLSTGPKTTAGRAKAALNGKKRQIGPMSIQEIRADLSALKSLIKDMTETRELVLG